MMKNVTASSTGTERKVFALLVCRLGRLLGNVPLGRNSPFTKGLQGRWCPAGTVQRLVSAAASVGDGRSPLGCITRAGRREGAAPHGLKSRAAAKKKNQQTGASGPASAAGSLP